MRLFLIALVLALVLSVVPSAIVVAQGDITILSSDAKAQFPYSITFSMEAMSTSDIVDVDIEIQADRRSLVPQSYRSDTDFESDQNVDVSWTWNMFETGGIPPGTDIEYRWIIEDASGESFESASSVVKYDDSRYDWNSLSSGQITLYWYEGSSSFAQQLIDAADEALDRLSGEFGVSLEQPITFYIYADAWDLQGSLVYADVWTGGMAFPAYDTIMLGIKVDNLDWGVRAVAHEVGHLVIGRLVFGPFGWLPTWLDEGVAMNAEGDLNDDFQDRLDEAIADDALFSVRSISSAFPADSNDARLSYAESYSVVRFLVDNYGSDELLELLDVFKQGNTDDEALTQVYGFDSDGLDEAWRASLGLGPRPPVTPTSKGDIFSLSAPYIALIVIEVILGILVIFLAISFIRRWR
ncbi:MAG: peptidase MA family metallohydrolase [Chloroflexota bacterium]|nr:peptidase MA family metallohydrolase [Chloroflexota bacterium]